MCAVSLKELGKLLHELFKELLLFYELFPQGSCYLHALFCVINTLLGVCGGDSLVVDRSNFDKILLCFGKSPLAFYKPHIPKIDKGIYELSKG